MKIYWIALALSCSVAGAEQVKGIDPITGGAYQLQKKTLGSWDIYTPPNNSEALIVVSKDDKPVVSVDELGGIPAVTVHDLNNSALTSVEVYDSDSNGVYDRIRFYHQDSSNGYAEAVLINGRWSYKEITAKPE